MRIDKLKNIIQSSHINFLFGSGLSCPYLKTLNNIETWLTDTNKIKEEKLRLLIQDNLFIMYVEEVMKPCLPNNRVRMKMNKIKRNWYKKKRIWFFAVMPIIWFVLYWNFPSTILVLSMPFLVLLGLYLVVVYLIFLYCILFNKNPMNW